MVDFHPLLRLAEGAALTAGAVLRARPADWQGVAADLGRDVKVTADGRSEQLILDMLGRGSDFTILAEEGGWADGAAGNSPPDSYWVVDPLDGSSNYSRDYPACAVSIALVFEGRLQLGVVYDFYRDELISGVVGDGCRLNHRPVTVSRIADKSKAVLMTGLPVARDFSDMAMQTFGAELAGWRKVRMIGSAALASAYVAVGRADCYKEEAVKLWDVAGGCALVLAAGGQVHLSDGPADQPKTVVAHNGCLDIAPA